MPALVASRTLPQIECCPYPHRRRRPLFRPHLPMIMSPPAAPSASFSRANPLIIVLIGVLLGSCDHVPGSPQDERNLIDASPEVRDLRGATPKAAGGGVVLPRAIVDDSQAWSPDGRWIAFHRAVPSQY